MSTSEQVSVPWELEEPWEWRTIREVATFIRGLSFRPDDKISGSEDGAVACLRTSNVQDEVEWGDLIFIDESHVTDGAKWVQQGDILMSTANSGDQVGRVAFVRELPRRATLGAFIGLVRVNDEMDPSYLYHWLNHPYMRSVVVSQARQTTNIANVSIPRLMDNPVPGPPIDVQRKLVAVLEEISRLSDLAREAADTMLQLPEALLESKLADVDSWEDATLEELSTEIRYGMSVAAADAVGDEYRYIRITDIDERASRLHDDGAIHFDDLGESELERFQLRPGDLLFARTGSIGTTYMYEESDGPAVFASYLIRVRIDDDLIDPRFVALWVRSHRGQLHLKGNSRGQVQQNINSGVIKSLRLPVPPVDIQQEIVEVEAHADAVREGFDRKRHALAELRTAVAIKAFMGDSLDAQAAAVVA